MRDLAMTDRIGIDGGGTSCRVALFWRGRRYDGLAGAANVTSDRDAALAAVRQGLVQVAAKAGLELDELRALPAYAGLAGVTGPGLAHFVARALPLDRVRVEDDRRAAVVGALGTRDGAVVGIGTGSFVARQVQYDVTFGGGYGLVLGDEASGAWLGRALLARVLHVADGLEEQSDLTTAMLKRLKDAEGIVQFAARATPAQFAALAPEVIKAATAGDSAAVALMQAGADYLARALRALDWRSDEPLCLFGGVAQHYAAFLPAAVSRAVMPPLGSALDGALALAEKGTLSRQTPGPQTP